MPPWLMKVHDPDPGLMKSPAKAAKKGKGLKMAKGKARTKLSDYTQMKAFCKFVNGVKFGIPPPFGLLISLSIAQGR
jgi:hypothetical protein